MNMQLIFPIITLVLMFFAILWKWIDWKSLAIKWVGYNPDRGRVCVKAGNNITAYNADRFYNGAEGDMYVFKPGKVFEIVVCPRKPVEYPHINIGGRRLIGLEDGQVVASPLGFMSEADKTKYKEGQTDLSSMTFGDQMSKAIKSLKSNKVTSLLIYGIIVLVIAGGVYFYMNKNNQPVESNQPAQEQPVNPVQSNEPVIENRVTP